jgi:hypothetical protein
MNGSSINILRRFAKAWNWARSSKFGLAAFLIPLGIRSVPELLVGPYPIGWDTIAFYVPNTLDIAAGKWNFVQFLALAPLMYMISIPVYLATRVNPVWIFKVMGPLLYGGMISALFRFLTVGLRWPQRMGLGTALFTSLYFVTLRISWDLYRNMLGLTFILLSLPLAGAPKTVKQEAWLAILVALAVLADQLTGVIVLSVWGVWSVIGLFMKNRQFVSSGIKIVLPGAVLFVSIAYEVYLTGSGLIQSQPILPTPDILYSSAGFFAYAYLPLIPLVVFGLRETRNLGLRIWMALCLSLALSALVPFLGPIVSSYRWTLLADLPMCVFAVLGFVKLSHSVGAMRVLGGSVQGRLFPLALVILVLGGALYIATPAQSAMVYYTTFPGLVPTSMIQDTVPLSDMPGLSQALAWVGHNMAPGGVLITHQAIYGWARAYLPSNITVLNYAYSDPTAGVRAATASGFSTILMIWWTNGAGWHGQPTVPRGFTPVVNYGEMVVYTHH